MSAVWHVYSKLKFCPKSFTDVCSNSATLSQGFFFSCLRGNICVNQRWRLTVTEISVFYEVNVYILLLPNFNLDIFWQFLLVCISKLPKIFVPNLNQKLLETRQKIRNLHDIATEFCPTSVLANSVWFRCECRLNLRFSSDPSVRQLVNHST